MAEIRAAGAEALPGVDGVGAEKGRVVAVELACLAMLLDLLAALGVGTSVNAPEAAA
ncbi:hypothetical protein ACFY4B_18175 [Kitasatospora sp. NPDC001261]|uniref:hypothetical protein n=1 Tax=Kitasatospora sp. NPDC001261 TaxID=3364012 RepID=UPI0036AFFF6D